jgi:2-octaprenyl-6-methoxyphenol hydroxylase
LHQLRLIDDQADRWTRPVIEVFRAEEVADTPFGHNVINADLVQALLDEAEGEANLSLTFDAPVAHWSEGQITLRDGVTLTADLILDAAGRKSPIPALAGIKMDDHRPDQTALVCQIEHSLDHEHISTEFQRREGPLTTVPMPPAADSGAFQSAIVWVHRPDTAQRLAALDDEAFRRSLQSALRGVLGEITALRARGGFPVGTQIADRFDAPKLALLGETAHVMPPIGAQGLNTSLADVAVLLSLIEQPSAVHDPDMLRRYSAQRRGDVIIRLKATHFLNQAIQNSALGFDHVRRGALKSLGWFKPVRHGLMRAGMRPFGVS